jgi:hypothetical protein
MLNILYVKMHHWMRLVLAIMQRIKDNFQIKHLQILIDLKIFMII